MDYRKIVDLLSYVSIPLLIIGLQTGIPIFAFCILLLALRLTACDLDTAGIYLVMFGGPMGGLIRNIYPQIPIYGMMLVALGLCLLLSRLKLPNLRSFEYLIALFALFAITYLYGPRSSYATEKMLNICLNGVLFLIAFKTILTSRTVSTTAMAQLLIVTALAMVSFAIIHFGFSGPTSWLDFKWLRHDSEVFFTQNQEHTIMNYQIVGMCGLYALAFVLSNKIVRIEELAYFIPVCIFVILTSGARQAMFGVIIVILIKVLFLANLSTRNKIIALVVSALFLTAYSLILSNEKVSTAAKIMEADNGGIMSNGARGVNFLAATLCIRDHPLLGAGLGGYESYIGWQGDQFGKWPHNVILEILCEMGVLGLVAIVLLVWLFLSRYKVTFRRLTRGNLYYFLLPTAMLCRFLASSDFGDSIALFSAVFAISGPIKENARRRIKFVIKSKKHKDDDNSQRCSLAELP